MIGASEGAFQIDQQAADNEAIKNADRWSAIWYEAYQNHASTAEFEKTQKDRRYALIKIQASASTMQAKIKNMSTKMSLIKAKLMKAEEIQA